MLNRLSDKASAGKGELHIHPELNLDYPHADIESVNELPDGKGFELVTTFFGLYGVASPLPGYYTEELLDEEWDERSARRGFLDVIHQQLYPLLYKAWIKYRFSHNAVESSDERYWEIIYSILGLPEEFREFGDLSGQFLKYAGILSQRPKTQLGLKMIISDYLESIDVDIVPCVRRDVSIIERQRCRLSVANNRLGQDSVIGQQVCDRSGKYNIRIGPLSSDQFQMLLSDRRHIRFIRTITDLYLVQPLQCDIVLELAPGAVRPVVLGQADFSCLGQSTWLVDDTNDQHFDVVLN